MFAELAPVYGCYWLFVYFGVERLVTNIVDNLNDVIVGYLYICMYNTFSGEIPGWSVYNKRRNWLTCSVTTFPLHTTRLTYEKKGRKKERKKGTQFLDRGVGAVY